ncbi:MAG: hypothetical protein LBG27_10355 [Spirochaetaceae bacterium]|nr:hypothetical protein [Spirochaetaceae bacterium]
MGSLVFGVEFNPTTDLGIEFGINGNITLSSGRYNLNIVNYSGNSLSKSDSKA